jgi:holo-[acyl-carrier protein] synthase
MIGIGTDIVEVERIKQKVDKPLGFREKVFSPLEIEICEQKGNLKYQSYAGRFAAKEALIKALGVNFIDEYPLNTIQILNHENGKPYFDFTDLILQTMQNNNWQVALSISHTSQYATAMVVIQAL